MSLGGGAGAAAPEDAAAALAARAGVGVADLSARALVRVRGRDRARFLHGMLTCEVAALRPGEGRRGAMLSPKGRVLATLALLAGEESLLLVAEPACRAALVEGLSRFIVMDDVTLEDETGRAGLVGLFGPEAAARLTAAAGAAVPPLGPYGHAPLAGGLQVVSWPGEGAPAPGFLVAGPAERTGALAAALVAAGAASLGPGALELVRLEAGWPRYGVDVDGERLPQEAALEEAVSFTKGCYIGQEPVARLHARGHANWRLRGLLVDGDEPPPRGARLSHPERADAGAVTSAGRSPTLGRVIALGYVHRTLLAPGTRLRVEPPGAEAEVTDVPFLRGSP